MKNTLRINSKKWTFFVEKKNFLSGYFEKLLGQKKGNKKI